MNKVLSYSQIKVFKRCRLKWYYGYVMKLMPRRMIERVELGNYGHALLEAHYNGEDIQEASAKYWLEKTKTMFTEEMDQFVEIRETAEKLVERYLKHYPNDNEDFNIIAAETDFKVSIRTPKGNKSATGLYGKLDLVVENDLDEIWMFDHKFTGIDLDKYGDGLELDEQANYYIWALESMFRKGKKRLPVAGIIFNLIRSKLPTVPNILKSGELSKAKNIDTDVETYLQAIKDNRLNPAHYAEFLTHVKETEKPFFKRHMVYRTINEIDEIGKELYLVAKDMRGCNIYRNATSDCSWDCQFRELCIMDKKGADTKGYIAQNYDIKR